MTAASSWKICVWCNLSSFSVRSREDCLKHMSSLAPFSFYRRNRESKYSWNYLQHIKHIVSCTFTGETFDIHAYVKSFWSAIQKASNFTAWLWILFPLVNQKLVPDTCFLTQTCETYTPDASRSSNCLHNNDFFFLPCFCSRWKPQWHCSRGSELMLPPQHLRAVPAPLRRLLEMHFRGPQLRTTRSESGVEVGSWAQKSVLNKLSRSFLCVLKFANHCL